MAVIIFTIDPGGYNPWLNRLIKGLSGCLRIFCHSSSNISPVNRSGLKSGALTAPNISPVSGIPTRITPRLPSMKFSRVFWILISSVVIIFCPGSGFLGGKSST